MAFASEKPMTYRQKEIFDFIVQHIKEDGRPPTMRGICKAFGWSGPNSAYGHLTRMQNRGIVGGVGKGTRFGAESTLHVTAGRKCRCCDGLGRIIDGTEED